MEQYFGGPRQRPWNGEEIFGGEAGAGVISDRASASSVLCRHGVELMDRAAAKPRRYEKRKVISSTARPIARNDAFSRKATDWGGSFR